MADTIETIGTILKEDPGRDAVHVAVIAAIAADELLPGTHVGFVRDGEAGECRETVGIVDPYLKAAVHEGERFWIFLYPKQITSLRHVWTHPGIKAESQMLSGDKAKSEAWLRRFCEKNDCPPYDVIIAVATDGSYGEDYYHSYIDGKYFHSGGSDAHGDIPDEFWDHVEIVTGKKQKQRPTYFSCSC